MAAGPAAAAVSGVEGAASGAGEGALGAADVEDFTVGAEHDAGDLGVAELLVEDRAGDGGLGFLQPGRGQSSGAGFGFEGGEGDVDDDLGAHRGVPAEATAVQGAGGDRGEGVVHALGVGAGVTQGGDPDLGEECHLECLGGQRGEEPTGDRAFGGLGQGEGEPLAGLPILLVGGVGVDPVAPGVEEPFEVVQPQPGLIEEEPLTTVRGR